MATDHPHGTWDNAFPAEARLTAQGLTKMEWFAGQVVSALAAAYINRMITPLEIARASYDIAEAMCSEGARRRG